MIEADASAAAPGDRVRVLFVDDDPGYLRAVRRLLRPGAAVELLVAGDGNTARRIVDADPPDMIVLDVYMPDLDGIEYCRRLKGQDRTEHSVVVVVSAAMTAGLEHAARDAGATRALDKVADLDELFRLIRNHRPTPRAEGRATGGSGSRARLQDPHEVAERLAVKLASAFDPWLDVPRATSAAQRALDLAAATYTPSCGESFPAFTERYVYAELFALVRAAACGDATPATADDLDDDVREVMRRLHASPSCVPFTTNLILRMRHDHGYSPRDIAAMLQLEPGQVLELCRRGRELLTAGAATAE